MKPHKAGGSDQLRPRVLKELSQDGRRFGEEVKLVDGLMHNLIRDGVMVTDVNQLLYAGSYVVSARLGLMDKKEGCATKNQW